MLEDDHISPALPESRAHTAGQEFSDTHRSHLALKAPVLIQLLSITYETRACYARLIVIFRASAERTQATF